MSLARVAAAALSLSMLGLSGCSLLPNNHLSGDFEGDFTQSDCEQLFSEFAGREPDDFAIQAYCAQQLGSLGQEGFNKMMKESIQGLRDLSDQLGELTDPETYAP
jgi:hypothetical protein